MRANVQLKQTFLKKIVLDISFDFNCQTKYLRSLNRQSSSQVFLKILKAALMNRMSYRNYSVCRVDQALASTTPCSVQLTLYNNDSWLRYLCLLCHRLDGEVTTTLPQRLRDGEWHILLVKQETLERLETTSTTVSTTTSKYIVYKYLLLLQLTIILKQNLQFQFVVAHFTSNIL